MVQSGNYGLITIVRIGVSDLQKELEFDRPIWGTVITHIELAIVVAMIVNRANADAATVFVQVKVWVQPLIKYQGFARSPFSDWRYRAYPTVGRPMLGMR